MLPFSIVDFFTGDRASDLGRLQSSNVFRLRDREGFLLRFTLTKNLRMGHTPPPPHRSLALMKFAHSDVCPVAWIQIYITVCQCLKVPLDQGYFFRTAERSGSIGSKPFTGSVVSNRLRKQPSEAKLYAGEIPHSFRVGLSNTLRLLGCSPEDVAHYLGWKSWEVARRYMQGSDATVYLLRFSQEQLLGQLPRSLTLIICRRLSELCFAVFAVLRLSLFCFV